MVSGFPHTPNEKAAAETETLKGWVVNHHQSGEQPKQTSKKRPQFLSKIA